MGSLFSLVLPNRIITPVDLFLSIPTNAFLVWKERRSISIKVVIPLSLTLLAGIIPGTFFLKVGEDWQLKVLLGIVVLGLALEMYLRKPLPDKNQTRHPVFLVLIGFISGILTGLFGIGALLVVYINRTAKNRQEFRANLCCVFLIENLFRFALYCIEGIMTPEVLFTTLFLSPAVILGMLAGIKTDKRMKEETVKMLIIALLTITGLFLVVKNGFFH